GRRGNALAWLPDDGERLPVPASIPRRRDDGESTVVAAPRVGKCGRCRNAEPADCPRSPTPASAWSPADDHHVAAVVVVRGAGLILPGLPLDRERLPCGRAGAAELVLAQRRPRDPACPEHVDRGECDPQRGDGHRVTATVDLDGALRARCSAATRARRATAQEQRPAGVVVVAGPELALP